MKNFFYLTLLASAPLAADFGEEFYDTSDCCCPYGVNPPVYIGDCSFGGHVDYLYWRAYSDNNAFALASTVGDQEASTSGFISGSADVEYDWHSGFRLGLDADIGCADWNIALDWTHFLVRDKGFAHRAAPEALSLTSIIDTIVVSNNDRFSTPLSSSAYATWKIDYNLVDLLFSRNFYVGCNVTLKPYGGLSALFLLQHQDSSAAASFILGGTGLPSQGQSNISAKAKTDFKGVGIKAGFCSCWEALSKVSLYGDASTSIYYGKSESDLTGNSVLNQAPQTPFTVARSYHAHRDANTLRATLDLAFGFEWRQPFSSSMSELVIKAGWEEHLLFRQNTALQIEIEDHFSSFLTQHVTQKFADISFQGLVISAALSF